jgi:hypothetical protein
MNAPQPPRFVPAVIAVPLRLVMLVVFGFLALAVGDMLLGVALMIHLIGACR